METQTRSKWARRAIVPAALALTAAALAGCSSTTPSSDTKQDPNSTVVIWGDATRQPAFNAFAKAHPDVKVKFEVIDTTTYLSKIQLANQVGSGWPDVIFDATPSDVASLQSPLFNYAQKLDNLVPADVQNNFATKNSLCTIDGHLYCLQNDLAQDVMWYNKPLLAQFGYTLPTTWADYQALGTKLAQEHPGYVIGGVGAGTVYYDYLWASGCPIQTLKSSSAAVINTADTKCTRVTSMLDTLVANGSVSRQSPFSPAMNKLAKAGKLLMMPAASWFGEYIFKPANAYGFPNGELAAGPMPSWPGEKTNYSGAEGGGIYVVSSHSKNTAGAVAAAQFAATDLNYQTSAPTYPAYIPAAKAWLAKVSKDPFYAQDPSTVLMDQASKINPAEAATRYDVASPVTSTLVASVTSGGTLASALAPLQSQLSGLAATAGYSVSDK